MKKKKKVIVFSSAHIRIDTFHLNVNSKSMYSRRRQSWQFFISFQLKSIQNHTPKNESLKQNIWWSVGYETQIIWFKCFMLRINFIESDSRLLSDIRISFSVMNWLIVECQNILNKGNRSASLNNDFLTMKEKCSLFFFLF